MTGSDRISFDLSDLTHCIADLGLVSAETVPNARKALEVTARGMKEDWRSRAEGVFDDHLRAFPYAIDYDVVSNPFSKSITAIIGPDLNRNQGGFGAVEESSGNWRSRPYHLRDLVVKANIKDFESGLTKAVSDGLA